MIKLKPVFDSVKFKESNSVWSSACTLINIVSWTTINTIFLNSIRDLIWNEIND